MCSCDPSRKIFCDYHRREMECAEGRHTSDCHRFESLAEHRQRTEEGRRA